MNDGGGGTHPPLKAPTGFRTGMAVAVASCRRADDWNGLEARRGEDSEVWRKARIVGARILEAMVKGGLVVVLWLQRFLWSRCGDDERRVGLVWLLNVCAQWEKRDGKFSRKKGLMFFHAVAIRRFLALA